MDRVGYTQVATTTPSTAGVCANGWSVDSTTSYCYQVMMKLNEVISFVKRKRTITFLVEHFFQLTSHNYTIRCSIKTDQMNPFIKIFTDQRIF